MSIHEQLTQPYLPKFESYTGDGKIAESAWTEFAKKHKIEIRIRPVSKGSIGRARLGKGPLMKTNSVQYRHTRHSYLPNDWTEYLNEAKKHGIINGKAASVLTISDYKRINNKERPWWAKESSQRHGLKSIDLKRPLPRTKHSDLYYLDYGRAYSLSLNGDIWVFRYFDKKRRCRRVAMIFPCQDEKHLILRQEDWFPKSNWEVVGKVEITKGEAKKLYERPELLANLFRRKTRKLSVAQS